MFSYFIRTTRGGSCLLPYKLPTTGFSVQGLQFRRRVIRRRRRSFCACISSSEDFCVQQILRYQCPRMLAHALLEEQGVSTSQVLRLYAGSRPLSFPNPKP